ncbi:uncharacterized protein LOC107045276 [Diachasma alloeum]|uniref:uncharacterized protein LOC107045276 n=1 Tax=Diachasma alloeum TaxID=454923 RepID=UPI000738493D|nr:uncharacterized protein LOC107045276 [Diachasma alloeum]
MQKEKPTTPTMRRAQTIARTRTPDRIDAASRARNRGQVRCRATMAPADFAVPGAPMPRRNPAMNMNMTRISIMPTSQLDSTRRLESEAHNNELGLLYDKYAQTLAEEHIVRKKIEEREKIIVTQLSALAKEQEQCDQKLYDIRMKQLEVSALNDIQRSSDAQIKEITALLKTYQGKPVETLGQIQSILKSLDTLTCKDVIIPKTTEEMEKFFANLEKCNEFLVFMNSTIGDKGKTINTGNQGLKNFLQTHENLQKYMENLEDAIEAVQIEVLKTISAALIPHQEQTMFNS